MVSRLLILSCTRRKRSTAGLLPAVDRYDGPAFRLFRRYLRQAPPSPPVLLVLSAEFGLIEGEQPVPWYDREITAARARELGSATADVLSRLAKDKAPAEVFLGLGRRYLDVLAESVATFPSRKVHVSLGSSGKRLAELHDWLHGAAPAHPVVSVAPAAKNIRFRGVSVDCDPTVALAAARVGLQDDTVGATRFQAWCVDIDGTPVAPKWLVSRITGLPVSSFHSDEARRLLVQLGLEARRP